MLLAPREHRRVQEGGGARAVAAGERLARGGRGDVGQLGPHHEIARIQVGPLASAFSVYPGRPNTIIR